MSSKSIYVGAGLLLFAAFAVGMLVYNSLPAPESGPAPQGNLVRFHSPTLGSPAAKVHIVEFLDPACETCRIFYPYVKQMMAAHPDKIRLSIRHVPFHKGSDQVVRMLEAAKMQGKYWQALDAVLAAQPDWTINHTAHPERVWPALEGLGLDIARLKVDMNAPEVSQRMAQDQEDARALNVSMTPEYFVNGRPLPSFGLQQLQTLVQDQVKAAY